MTDRRTGGVAISPVPGPTARDKGGRGGVAISPVPGPTARREIIKGKIKEVTQKR